ncbi:hypothetical protein HK102_012566, partial [Quaeritorhiza haematococci]
MPPVRDVNHRQIIIFHTNRFLTEIIDPLEFVRAMWFVFERALEDEETQVHGVTVVVDAKGAGWRNCDTRLLNLLLDGVQNRIPLRLGALYLLRPPTVFKFAWSSLSPFINPKIHNRIHVLSSSSPPPSPSTDLPSEICDILNTYLGSHAVPKQLGGDLTFDDEKWVE